jgi:hypothetical protein
MDFWAFVFVLYVAYAYSLFNFLFFLFSFVQVMLACGKYNLVYEFFNKVEKSLIPGALNYKGNTCNLA